MNETRFTRAGGIFAGVTYVLAHCVVLFDAGARAQLWPGLLSTGAAFGVLLWDERRSPALRPRMFASSRTVHIIAFGPIAVLMHFLRTRWPVAKERVGFVGWVREVVTNLKRLSLKGILTGSWRRIVAVAVGIFAMIVVAVPEMVLSPPQPDDDDIGVADVAVVLLGIVLVWRLLVLLDRWFVLDRVLVVVGLVILFGSTLGIGIVLHR